MGKPTLEQQARTQRLALMLDHLKGEHDVDPKTIDFNHAQAAIEELTREKCHDCRAAHFK